jgi:hypothetical protein
MLQGMSFCLPSNPFSCQTQPPSGAMGGWGSSRGGWDFPPGAVDKDDRESRGGSGGGCTPGSTTERMSPILQMHADKRSRHARHALKVMPDL